MIHITRARFSFAALVFALSMNPAALAASPHPRQATQSARTAASHPALPKQGLACRVLDSWKVKDPAVALAIFHQAHKADGPELGAMLRSRDGARVEFETPDGEWHSATVLRAGSCFGRGLLVFPAAGPSLSKHEIIRVKFSPET